MISWFNGQIVVYKQGKVSFMFSSVSIHSFSLQYKIQKYNTCHTKWRV